MLNADLLLAGGQHMHAYIYICPSLFVISSYFPSPFPYHLKTSIQVIEINRYLTSLSYPFPESLNLNMTIKRRCLPGTGRPRMVQAGHQAMPWAMDNVQIRGPPYPLSATGNTMTPPEPKGRAEHHSDPLVHLEAQLSGDDDWNSDPAHRPANHPLLQQRA